jgi:hypothetical protein
MPPPAPEPIRFEVLLSQSWTLFRRNWIVALPPVIAFGIIIVAIAAFAAVAVAVVLAHGGFEHAHFENGGSAYVGAFVLAYLGFMVVVVILSLWVNAAVYGMADAAWERGTATFGDGFAAFRTRSGALFVAGLGFIGLALVALILALPTLGLAFLAFPLFTMFVLPAVVGGGRGGFDAIGESFRLVRDFFGASAITWLVLTGIHYGISLIATFALMPLQFAMIPLMASNGKFVLPAIGLLAGVGVAFILAIAATLAYAGYYAIAVVGLYRSLRAQSAGRAFLDRIAVN